MAVVADQGDAVREGGGDVGEREGEETTLRVSDLEGGEGGGTADFESKIQSLQNEVDVLTSRLEEEHLLNSQCRQQQAAIPLTRSSLDRHNNTTSSSLHPHPPPSPEMRVLGQVASLMSSQLHRHREQEERERRRRREKLADKLAEVERESCAIREHVEQLHNSVKKMVMYICTFIYS